MPDITIPDAAVEAAYHRARGCRIDPIIGTGDVRLIIAAAAPHIAAQVASDIHGQFGVNVSDEMSDWWDGYRQAQRDVLRKLREIEAYYRIEADHG